MNVDSVIRNIYTGSGIEPYSKFFDDLKKQGYFPEDTNIDLYMFANRINKSKTDYTIWTIFILKDIRCKSIYALRRLGILKSNKLGSSLSRRTYQLRNWIKKTCDELYERGFEEYRIADFIGKQPHPEILKYFNEPMDAFPKIYKNLYLKGMNDNSSWLKTDLKHMRNKICDVKPYYIKDYDIFPWNMLFNIGVPKEYIDNYGVDTLIENEKAVSYFLTMLSEYTFGIPYNTSKENNKHFYALKECGEKYIIESQPTGITAMFILYLYYQKDMSLISISKYFDRSITNIGQRFAKILRQLRSAMYRNNIDLKIFFTRNMNKFMENIYLNDLDYIDTSKNVELFSYSMSNPLLFDLISNGVRKVNEEYSSPARIICRESSTPESLPLPQTNHYRFTSTSTTLDDEVTTIKMWDDTIERFRWDK